jgi:Derlin-2/3
MEFEQFYNSLPKFTKFYMISVFVVTFFTTYVKAFPLGYWLILDIDKILENFQIWRLFTNFLFVGKFSMNFLFFLMMMYVINTI